MKTLTINFWSVNDFIAICDRQIVGRVNTISKYSFKNAVVTVDQESAFAFLYRNKFEWILKREDDILYILRNTYKNNFSIESVKGVNDKVSLECRFLKRDLNVMNTGGEIIFIIHSYFSWKEFDTIYSVECVDDFGNTDSEKAIILMCVYYYKLTANSD